MMSYYLLTQSHLGSVGILKLPPAHQLTLKHHPHSDIYIVKVNIFSDIILNLLLSSRWLRRPANSK